MILSLNRLPHSIAFIYLLLFAVDGYSQRNSQAERLVYADSLLRVGLKNKDSSQIAEAYYLFGKDEHFRFNFRKSNEWFYRSLAIIEKQGDSYELGRLYLRFSENDSGQGHYHDALRNINAAIQIYSRVKSEKGLMTGYLFLGGLHRKEWGTKGNPDFIGRQLNKAIFFLKKAENLAIKLKDIPGLAQTRHIISHCLADKNDRRAIDYLKASLKIYDAYNLQVPKANGMINLAQRYMTFNQLDDAGKVLKESETFIYKNLPENYGVLLHLEEVFAVYCGEVRDWKCAYEHHRKRDFYSTNVAIADRNGAVSRLNIEFETQKRQAQLEKQQLEIALKDQNLTLQRRFLWIVGLLLFFAFSLIFVLYRLYQKNKQISEKNAILVQEQNHRVKNNLQVISSLLNLQAELLEDTQARQAVDESQLRIDSMVILHRQLYDNDQPDKIDMEVFVSELSAIIFQSYGFSDIEVNYTISIHQMQADKAIFFGLMLNELISNACKYAFADHPDPKLDISLYEEKNEIVLIVKDNGRKNIENMKKENPASFGLKLIDMMVVQLDGKKEINFNNGFEFIMKCKV